jgi:hypothetical protein
MSALTRRRDPEAHQEVWHGDYGDVRVGTIGERAGVPVGVEQWGWSCGIYRRAPVVEKSLYASEEALTELINAKRNGKTVGPRPRPKGENVVDLMDALKKSIAGAQKAKSPARRLPAKRKCSCRSKAKSPRPKRRPSLSERRSERLDSLHTAPLGR